MGLADGGLAGVRRLAAELRLGFVPQDAVRWFAPAQLERTGIKVALSTVFADFDDKREIQAAFPGPAVDLQLPQQGDVWIDFVADLGDGFDATYTVALLLAEPQLSVPGVDHPLPRGRVLLMGGDEVYPTPSAQLYEDRTKGPYRTALTEAAAGSEGPYLLALPGNHDWYDGLTAFLRTFAQKRRIGGWRTLQTRSYWVAQLRPGWWLAGLDTQLTGEIDEPQLAYFREHLSSKLQEGDQVIVSVPSPTWVKAARDPHAFDALHYFERHFVRHHRDDNSAPERATGAVVRLWITGDSHHWAHYVEEQPDDGVPRHLVTCGLGGAYLSSTHHLPEQLTLPPHDLPPRERDASDPDDTGQTFRLASRSPSEADSKARKLRLLWPPSTALPRRNPGFIPVIGGVQAALFAAFAILLGIQMGTGPMTAVAVADVGDVLQLALRTAVVVVVVVLFRYARAFWRRRHEGPVPGTPDRPPSFWVRAISLQLGVAFVNLLLAVAVSGLVRRHVPWPGEHPVPGWLIFGLWLLFSVFVLGIGAAWLFALSLLRTRDEGALDWQDSAQADEEHKGFVRMLLAADGSLTLHALIADHVRHDWKAGPDGRIAPVEGLPPLRLAEPPIVIPARGRTVPG